MNEELLESYDYELDASLIATHPMHPKSAAKLLVYNRREDSITHTTFKDFLNIIPRDYLIVLNDTKVLKARIFGHKKSGAKIEILYHNFIGNNQFLVQIKGRIHENDEIELPNFMRAKVCKKLENGLRIVEFYERDKIMQKDNFLRALENIGNMPIPPYIKRETNAQDDIDYQSVFAKYPGAIAAPTASLHFDENDLAKLRARKHCFITLHVGAGTFFNIETPKITQHKMHKEEFFISNTAKNAIDAADKVLCIGTTACRCVEFYASNNQTSGLCDIFINPLNPPRKTNALLTNFHLPKTTLIMLVAGFIGIDKTKEIYSIARDLKYRFYSYGDGMLIL